MQAPAVSSTSVEAAAATRMADGYGVVREHIRDLRRAFRRIDRRLATGTWPAETPARAVEWLLDNAYVVAEAVRQLGAHLTREFHRHLPKLAAPPAPPRARVQVVAEAVVTEAKGVLDIGRLRRFLSAYQEVRALTLAELWALPAMLRLVLLEELAGLAASVVGLAPAEPGTTAAMLENAIANHVLSLRRLDACDWKEFVESVSVTDRALRDDPSADYERMDFATRDRYRKVIEELARWSSLAEEQVARTAVALAGAAPPGEWGRRHTGYYLLTAEGRDELERRLACRGPRSARLRRTLRRRALPLYLAAVGLSTLGLALAAAIASGGVSLAGIALALLPASAAGVAAVNWFVTHVVPPAELPKLEAEGGIPRGCRTVVVVPALLTRPDEVEELLEHLEINFHGNEDPELAFALLTDFGDAPERHRPGDAQLLRSATAGVRRLNRRYATAQRPAFFLFHRDRRWNPREGCWMGWERKRGKLVQFTRLLSGAPDAGLRAVVGDPRHLRGTRYVITLDADTMLPNGTAARLVATAAHPLNRARFDQHERVIAGYTVLQPRLDTAPSGGDDTVFASVFQGDTTLDLYSRAVSDVYQDLFDEGTYVGKGIYDVHAFERTLAGRVPENAVLSHDLFEGAHGRAGLVSDIVLLEEYPSHMLGYFRRLHRWVRGDWQLLPWLLGRVPDAAGRRVPTCLSPLNRWKILDNLRRSLVAPSLVALLVAAWLWLPGAPGVWTGCALAFLAMPVFLQAVSAADQAARRAAAGRAGAVSLLERAWNDLLRWVLRIVFLAYESVVVIDAVGRTLVRLLVTRRHMLEWTSAAHIARALRGNGAAASWRAMLGSPLLAVAGGLAVLATHPGALAVAAPLISLWAGAPAIAHLVSRPRNAREGLERDGHAPARRIARRTWLFFEHAIGPDQHWLAPDHVRDEPGGGPVHRTSPTNLGMTLVSVVAAHDLGYVDRPRLAATLRSILESMEGLERYRGHFFNWYDTRGRTPLEPRYVSTVDSGNLAAALLVVRQACRDAVGSPLLGPFQRAGLEDTVAALREAATGHVTEVTRDLDRWRKRIAETGDGPAERQRLLDELTAEGLPTLEATLDAAVDRAAGTGTAGEMSQVVEWFEELRRHAMRQRELLDALLPWGALVAAPPAAYRTGDLPEAAAAAWTVLRTSLDRAPSLAHLPAFCRAFEQQVRDLDRLILAAAIPSALASQALEWNERLVEALRRAAGNGRLLCDDLLGVGGLADTLFRAMDFRFLFDRGRRLFHIGYDATARQPDPNHYDLLASEARLASFIAIAKADAPARHWLQLGRPLARRRRDRLALSWAGTMFEFLMPALFTATPRRTLLGRTCRAAVRRQIAFGKAQDVPWGMSESAYARRDAQGTYRYRAFGVPGLGLRREVGDRLVIAPYASALALRVAPRAALDNLAALEALGAFGRYGYVEALDFGPPDRAGRGTPVRSYMAHHQGMILAAIDNALNDDVLVRRVHRDPRIASVAPLLHERMPRHAPVEPRWLMRPARVRAAPGAPSLLEGWSVSPEHPIPQTHLLSNGRYSVLISATGGGGSRWQGTALTRWRADPAVDSWGHWLYVQDLDTGELHSATREPVRAAADDSRARFAPHLAEFRAVRSGLHLLTRVAVSPVDDVELRVMSVKNESERARRLAVTSFGEVALAPPAEDRRHPAFAKLFVESEAIPELDALVFRRRPKAAGERTPHLAHGVVPGAGVAGPVSWESDRARFLGRRGDPGAPDALAPPEQLPGTVGATLDPAFALRCELTLQPDATAEVAFVTAAAASRADVLALLDAYRSFSRIEATFAEAAAHAEAELREVSAIHGELPAAQELFSAVVYPYHDLRASPAVRGSACRGQSALWAHGISGDLPIIAVAVGAAPDLPVVRELLRAQRGWSSRGARIDLVFIDEQSAGYEQPVQGAIERAIAEIGGDAPERGGIFVVPARRLGAADRAAIECAARVLLRADRGGLSVQLAALRHRPSPLPEFVPAPSSPLTPESTPALALPTDLEFDNGFGGFADDGREYVVLLGAERRPPRPPAPWANVVANPRFGFLVSETGEGCTWADNSAENRLTPWRNDPLKPPPGEAVYLRDEETGRIWSPTPEPAGSGLPYLVRHGAGYSVFQHNAFGLEQELRLFAHPREPVKLAVLRLTNRWRRPRRITATYYAEWVLGASRELMAPHVIVGYDANRGALLARCPFNEMSGTRVAFLAASRPPHGFTADREEFLGRERRWARPAGLERIGLSGTAQAGRDPCAALQVHLDIPPHASQEVHFFLGQGLDHDDAGRLMAALADPAAVRAAWTAVRDFWGETLGRLQVRTPDRGLDLLLNRWLPYQTLACGLWARTGLYQPSGAFGFRDQLQDVMALIHAGADLARGQILEAARRQFSEGDVLHWWHPGTTRGVRTRCSDDLVWLPFCVAHYVDVTGEIGLLDERVPFLEGPPLRANETERYDRYQVSEADGSIYEHCRRALDRAWVLGPRGLPLIGSGDWNDGFNRLGLAGRGESVWLAWFLYASFMAFASLSARSGHRDDAERFRARAEQLRRAVERDGWDGGWYRRAYDDHGMALGSASSRECRIDSTAQSWAVLSGGAVPDRAEAAMDAVWTRLVRPQDGLILLLAPPFERADADPGYIRGYPPGVRENGAQYTHAAVWVAWAFAELGDGDRAGALVRLLNPIYRAATPDGARRYRGEPYVAAGDVLARGPLGGRAGWTWYTGSAGWLYRLGVERILGIRRRGATLDIDPRIPRAWTEYEITYVFGATTYHIRVENPDQVERGVALLEVDGHAAGDGGVPLSDDGGTHQVLVRLGSLAPAPGVDQPA